MNDDSGALALPLADGLEVIRFAVIDDEPLYRSGLDVSASEGARLEQVGGYEDVISFLHQHRRPCHVLVLDLCLNRRTGNPAALHGVQAVEKLAGELGHRVLIHTADPRPEPVARCLAAGAVGYVSKYNGNTAVLAQAITEIAHHGHVRSPALTAAIQDLVNHSQDIRLSDTVEMTLTLLGHGLTNKQIAEQRQISVRTVEGHKDKIRETFGDLMDARGFGLPELSRYLGIGPGDLIPNSPRSRPTRNGLRRALDWAWRRPPRRHSEPPA